MDRHADRTEDLEDPRRKNMPAEDLENIDSELDDDDDDFDDEIEIDDDDEDVEDIDDRT